MSQFVLGFQPLSGKLWSGVGVTNQKHDLWLEPTSVDRVGN